MYQKAAQKYNPNGRRFPHWHGILLCFALFGWTVAGCISAPQETPGVPAAMKPGESAPMAAGFAPDGYYEPIPPLPDKGYILLPLADNVYFFSTGAYNNMFVVTREGVVITDPIRGAGPALKRAIREVTDLPVRFMIYSHAHLDHIGDAHLFAKNTKIIAHNETRDFLLRYRDPSRPPPQISFEQSYLLKVGGLTLELIYPGPTHEQGNIVIHIPDRKVLMFVDVATPKSVPGLNFETVDIYNQVVALQRAVKLDFDTYVAGHLYRPGKKAEMNEVLQYYYASRKADAEAMRAVSRSAIAERSRSRDVMRRLGEYYNAVADACYARLKETWKRRLMGFEAFARSHCQVWTLFHGTHKEP